MHRRHGHLHMQQGVAHGQGVVVAAGKALGQSLRALGAQLGQPFGVQRGAENGLKGFAALGAQAACQQRTAGVVRKRGELVRVLMKHVMPHFPAAA